MWSLFCKRFLSGKGTKLVFSTLRISCSLAMCQCTWGEWEYFTSLACPIRNVLTRAWGWSPSPPCNRFGRFSSLPIRPVVLEKSYTVLESFPNPMQWFIFHHQVVAMRPPINNYTTTWLIAQLLVPQFNRENDLLAENAGRTSSWISKKWLQVEKRTVRWGVMYYSTNIPYLDYLWNKVKRVCARARWAAIEVWTWTEWQLTFASWIKRQRICLFYPWRENGTCCLAVDLRLKLSIRSSSIRKENRPASWQLLLAQK